MSEKFKIIQLTVEARYPDSFLIWDYSGRIWTEMSLVFPNMSMMEAGPNRVSFQADDRWTMEVTLNSARLSDSKPNSAFDKDSEKIEKFFEIVCRLLKIETIKRLGILLLQTWTFPSEEELAMGAAELLMKGKKWGKYFDVVGSKKFLPSVNISVEDDDLGYSIRIQPETRAVEIKVGVGETLVQNQSEKEHRINLSVDQYTLKPVDIEQLNLTDVIKRIKRVTNRDMESLLKEVSLVQ